MFGKRGISEPPPPPPPTGTVPVPAPENPPAAASDAAAPEAVTPVVASAASGASSGAAARAAGILAGVNDDSAAGKPKPPERNTMNETKERIYALLMEQIDIATSSRLPRDELKRQIIDLIGEIVIEQRLALSSAEQQLLANQIVDDMLGFGPLEPLLRDEFVTDIMVNGPWQIYVERKGKLELTDIKFRDNAHVMSIATRIVTGVGRRVDESTPICDARLPDGSRVNVIAPPLSIKGCSISIRKFAQKKITLDTMASTNNISENLCKLLKICGAIRLNIIISGGTGSGKTTLLNALSRMISHGERVVTIEDAAELQLQQPHVVPLETRQANLEGDGEITMRDLVKNALRMRPDRIILGEVRGGEAFDLLQAMNTGHDGSMGTLHANNPREALARLENLIGMAGTNLPSKAVRQQIASAVNLIVQIQRMRDGTRRVTHVSEIVGMEGEVIVAQDLFTFEFQGEDENGKLIGTFKSSGIRPNFMHKAQYFGLEQALLEAMAV
jgi:pilus assembly protein CpaF